MMQTPPFPGGVFLWWALRARNETEQSTPAPPEALPFEPVTP